MILRLLHLRILPGAASELIERLRIQVVPEALAVDGLIGLNYGLRLLGDQTYGLAASVWRDYDAIIAALGGKPDEVGTSVALDDLVADVRTAHYELPEPESAAPLTADGACIGVVVARLKPHVEQAAFELIRASAPLVHASGAIVRYIGRRIQGSRSEVVAISIWPDRATLRQFARNRPEGAIGRAFLELLESWSFVTYDTMSPRRLLVPSGGPAVLLADDEGSYVDASVGVERVLGVPGEFMLGRSVWDFTSADDLELGRRLWRQFIADGRQEGEYPLMHPDGHSVRVRYRAVANHPRPGLHASVIELPADPHDERTPEEIVEEAFPGQANGGGEGSTSMTEVG